MTFLITRKMKIILNIRMWLLCRLNKPWALTNCIWKPGNSVENSNGMVHPDGNFPDKSNTFQGIIFFPFLPKKIMTKIFCTICLVNQCSQTSSWGGWCMICFNPGTTLTHSSFKNVFKSSTICQKFFTEISLQTVSVPYINNIKNSLLMLKSNLVPRICTGCKVITCQPKILRTLGTKLLISEKKMDIKIKNK